MSSQEINTLIEKNILKDASQIKVNRMKYMMEFGEVSIQYDFCLN